MTNLTKAGLRLAGCGKMEMPPRDIWWDLQGTDKEKTETVLNFMNDLLELGKGMNDPRKIDDHQLAETLDQKPDLLFAAVRLTTCAEGLKLKLQNNPLLAIVQKRSVSKSATPEQVARSVLLSTGAEEVRYSGEQQQ